MVMLVRPVLATGLLLSMLMVQSGGSSVAPAASDAATDVCAGSPSSTVPSSGYPHGSGIAGVGKLIRHVPAERHSRPWNNLRTDGPECPSAPSVSASVNLSATSGLGAPYKALFREKYGIPGGTMIGRAPASLSLAETHSVQTFHALARSSHVPIHIGALYPLTGSQGPGGREEFHGLQTAALLVNRQGGVRGRSIQLEVVDSPSADAAPGAVDTLAHSGISIIAGSYGSTISVPASAQAQRDNVVFWESGAVATMVTEHGYPNVFRTVTTGQSLGRAAARYLAQVVVPRLHVAPSHLRAAVLYANDVYGSSVGPAMVDEVKVQGFKLAGTLPYNPYTVKMPALVSRLKAMHPDLVLVVGYVEDAVAFRRETIRQGLHPAAMIGTSSAFCMHAFGDTLGARALGLFASDKPDATFSAHALLPAARTLRTEATKLYKQRYGVDMSAAAVAGFVAGWVLFHEVLPRARSLSPAAIREAALSLDLPYGSQINGAGIKFAPPSAPDAGQNLRAISVIWQWQSPGHEVIVYPRSYATAAPKWIPLPGWQGR